jgi:hypothetical protein
VRSYGGGQSGLHGEGRYVVGTGSRSFDTY